MIIFPALAGIAVILESVIVSATVGVAISSALCAGSGAVNSFQEQGNGSKVAQSAAQGVVACAEDGTLVTSAIAGAAFGAIAPLAGPALQAVDDVVGPVLRPGAHALRAPLHMSRARAAALFASPRRLQKLCSRNCIYVMDDAANGLQKVGRTKNPVQRIAAVQRDVKSKLFYSRVSPVDDAVAAEKQLHRLFSGKNVKHPNHATGTEWFKDLSRFDLATVWSR